MKPSRSTILVLILVGVCIVVQGLLSNIVAEQLTGWLGPWVSYIPVAFVLISIGLVGLTVRDQITSTLFEQRRSIDQRQIKHHRRAMLAKVRLIWIDGVLKDSLYQETLITLRMHHRPQAVAPPRGLVIQRSRAGDRLVEVSNRILHVFDEVGGALLILGAPGAGKTTVLLELARDLLDRAAQDSTLPIPVIFPLSSWAVRSLPLEAWLVDELGKRYDVGTALAHAWIAADLILPLLDGLDEVAPIRRAACVEAINTYRQSHGLLPLVVSSRSMDYDELLVKLRLHSAIEVQPLSRDQVRDYLRQIGLRVAPSNTSPVWDLLDTPLMLNIATLTYAGQGTHPIPLQGTVQEQRDHLFTAYVARMFERHPSSQNFPHHRALHWLAWLAWQMQQRNQTVFYLEHLQPTFLPTHASRRAYVFLDRIILGGVLGILPWVAFSFVFGIAEAIYNWNLFVDAGKFNATVLDVLADGKIVMLVSAVITMLFGGQHRTSLPGEQGIVERIRSALFGGLITGLVCGLGSVVVRGLEIGLSSNRSNVVEIVTFGLVTGLVSGICGVFVGGITGPPDIRPRSITAVETLTWSWKKAWQSILGTLVSGVVVGLIGGPLAGIVLWIFDDTRSLVDMLIGGLDAGVRVGFGLGGIGGLLAGLVGGFTGRSVERKVHPNQGIQRSARHALIVGGGSSVTIWLLAVVAVGVSGSVEQVEGWDLVIVIGLIGLVFGMLIGPAIGLANGGYAYFSHAALRLVLGRTDVVPLAYVRFLDENAQRILLRKVGGGYSFIHRLLLDYFAKQYRGPETTDVSTVHAVRTNKEQEENPNL